MLLEHSLLRKWHFKIAINSLLIAILLIFSIALETVANAQDTDVDAMREEIGALKRELEAEQKRTEKYKRELIAAKAEANRLRQDGPSGEQGSRGGFSQTDIIGKISTPAGIEGLTINGDDYELDEANRFWAKVSMANDQIPVDIVAVDKSGQKIDFSFSIMSEEDAQEVSILEGIGGEAGQLNIFENIDMELGNYHALIIGNDNYQNFPMLRTAAADATAVAEILQSKYGFKTKLLVNSSYYQTLAALDELRSTLTANDNLLIFYAGHGETDQASGQGYWLPVDAATANQEKWISNEEITKIIESLPAKHVMLVADSCYTDTAWRDDLSDMSLDMEIGLDLNWVKAMGKARTRTVLASGGEKPVLNIGVGQHSVFTAALLSVLQSNEGLLEGNRLHREVFKKMRVNMPRFNRSQIPLYSPIKHAGHQGGEFFLRRVKT